MPRSLALPGLLIPLGSLPENHGRGPSLNPESEYRRLGHGDAHDPGLSAAAARSIFAAKRVAATPQEILRPAGPADDVSDGARWHSSMWVGWMSPRVVHRWQQLG